MRYTAEVITTKTETGLSVIAKVKAATEKEATVGLIAIGVAYYLGDVEGLAFKQMITRYTPQIIEEHDFNSRREDDKLTWVGRMRWDFIK